jgi:ubiquinone/menaquinone biosynthesis C-methylase UbiE
MQLKNRDESSGRSPADCGGRVREFFDHQAATFERRAGLPDLHCREIAQAVLEIGEARAGDLVVELGPGTGQIGRWLCAPTLRYVGIDLSIGMLREFRARLDRETVEGGLVRADANISWPLAAASARIVFSSRAIHLLDQEHVAREMLRTSAPSGATLIIGRVKREPEGMRERMARAMNERLRQRGLEGRGGEKQRRVLAEACGRVGAQILEPLTIARWKVKASPRRSLDSWRGLASLGGINVPAQVRAEILMDLEDWADKTFNGLDREFESEEAYVLYPLRYGARKASGLTVQA